MSSSRWEATILAVVPVGHRAAIHRALEVQCPQSPSKIKVDSRTPRTPPA
jgi:pheromone shutdown protein TraB